MVIQDGLTYRNPILPGCYPDPSICRVGKEFYLVTSSFHYYPGVPIFRSDDLINWQQIGHCLTRTEQLNLEECKSSLGIFAPTIRHHKGRFYMITTNMNTFRNFIVWADQPEGPWSQPLWLQWPGIDPSLFFDEDDRAYITGNGGFLGDEPLGIYQAEIDPDTGELLTDRQFIWSGTGGQAPEGPHLYKVNDQYFLLIAEGGTEYGHMVTIARSHSPYGPFESCPYNPILSHRSTRSPIQGTGHADLVSLEDGSWWAVFLGIRPAPISMGGKYHHLGRETFLAPVTWTEDGWPIIGEKGKVSEIMQAGKLPAVISNHAANYIFRDDFNTKQLDFRWNFLRNPLERCWSLREHPSFLTLYGNAYTLNDVASPAFVGIRQMHFNCSIATQLYFDPIQEGEEAGLTVYMDESFHYEIALSFSGGVKEIIFRRRVGSLWKIEATEKYEESGPIIFSIEAGPVRYQFSYAKPNEKKRTVGVGECSLLSTEVAGGFTGVYFGLYATGNQRNCAVPAKFDWFQYNSNN